MYSAGGKRVNGAAWVFAALFPLTLASSPPVVPALSGALCDTSLQALFTPPYPRFGRYETCVSQSGLAGIIPPGWQVHALDPLDAFGLAGPYDRSALARLYGGQQALVARGWIEESGGLESRTYISPHPDVELRRLVPGTLIIRFIICCT